MKKHNELFTYEYLNDNLTPLKEYPNPQFIRDSYISLNGLWKYKITKDKNNLSDILDDILVPYPIESYNSKVQKRLQYNEYIIYKLEFKLKQDFIKYYTFLNFLGIDQKFEVILNGHYFNETIPLLLPTKIDITNYIKEENELYIICKDELDYTIPYGKQSKNPKSIFYTPFSGIYFPVYIESVNKNYIQDFKIKTTLDTLYLDIKSNSDVFNIIITDHNNNHRYSSTHKNNNIEIKLPNPIPWSTDNPYLYNIEISTSDDKVTSYFGLKEFKIKNSKFYLNNNEIFLNGLLYQGYFPEGIITPSSYETLENDIKLIKELGFNTIRLHIKVELPYFYYLCDKYGIIVFQDFVNNGKYSFIKQTLIPTIGFKNIKDINMNKNNYQRNNFLKANDNLINYLYNHPSIIGYTIFNEGWGQFDSDNIYTYFKNKYPSIIFDATSGWFFQSKSDLNSEHLYFNNINKLKKFNKTIFLSEFGALCYKLKDNCYSNKKVFAYKYFKSKNDLETKYIDLFENKIIPYKNKLNGIIYTQFNDIEEEDNGLVSYDRKVLKINKEIIQNINNKLNNK